MGDAPLNVEGHKITGELPWSYTVPTEAITNNGTSVDPDYIKYAMNAEFVLSKYAALRTMLNDNDNYPLYSNGDSNDDGSTDNATTWDGNNMKFLFVRNQDGTVSVYRTTWNGTTAGAALIKSVFVRAEDRLALKDNSTYKVSQTEYTFDLTWKAPSNEAEISNFTVAGRTGTVTNTSETERTITVQVPYGTDLKGMIATFEHSLAPL